MLKKIIIGILCFIILAAAGGGIYVYTLDWNKHKAVVAQRFSQITGLNALIDGNLKVELFPSPKISANKVKFFKNAGSHDPLVVVNEISANLDLMPLLDNKFVVKSMSLTQAMVNINISEKGESNWSGVGSKTNTKSGNVEVSFDNMHLTNSTISYKNLKENEEFELPNISATINAPSLKGPYKTDGKFIYNNSEIRFKGTIVKDNTLSLNMAVENISTGTKAAIEGSLGDAAKGNVSFETQNLADITEVLFGDAALQEHYGMPLYVSFKYNYDKGLAKLDNFITKYGKGITGSGSVILKNAQNTKEITANFDMTQFDLDVVENICQDVITFIQAGKKIQDTDFAKYSGSVSFKSARAQYKGAEAQNLSIGISFKNNIVDVTRLGIILPGDTVIKSVGKINLNDGIQYQFNQAVESKDLRTFASLFNIDLSKLASPDNKKSIFKHAMAEIKAAGDLNHLKITIPTGVIDSTGINGNIGFVRQDGKSFVVANINTSQILFDKYLIPVPAGLEKSSLKDKLIYQFNLIPWNKDIAVDATVTIASAVYNRIPLEKVQLEFNTVQDNFNLKKLAVANFAGAALDLNFDATAIYTNPSFTELSYNVKTNNLPMLTSALGIDTGSKSLFSRKTFASQGALSGTLDEFNLSSVQKFGDTEFSYTGVVSNTEKETAVNGDLELKSNNFNTFTKALDIDYTPSIPVTSFTLSGKVKGSADIFSLENINAYLGANNIKGQFMFDNSASTPKLAGKFDFDKFDADKFFNLSKKSISPTKETQQSFIQKPHVNDGKIDYSLLKKADFDIKANASQLVYQNKTYTNAQISTILKDGVLNVSDFKALRGDSNIDLQFILNSNSIPKINGSFNLKAVEIPNLGGLTYLLEGGQLNADGTFDSLAASLKDFFENLNSRGKFQLLGTAVKGWDLDIIKFELEQRKSIAGFEDTVLNSLRSGRSIFSSVKGKYNISKGLIVADNVLWESPVANISMKFDLNLSDWLFTAVFNTVYHNASFSDIVKFTFGGSLDNPIIKTDLSESIKRIGEAENTLKSAQNKQEQEKQAKLALKIKKLKDSIHSLLQDISRMTLDVVRFKPVTDNKNTAKIYDENILILQNTEKKLQNMEDSLRQISDETKLMNMEAELSIESSKLKFIPKTLEENYIVDSKYVFDDTFNKIAWLYNVAQNNFSYYNSLSGVYMGQVHLLSETDTPVAEEKEDELEKAIKSISDDMDKISSLHGKIRDNYLTIIDSVKISEMKENNEIAKQALKTILTYLERMDNKIINNIDDFRAVLSINTRDYDEYMVYPPKDIKDIDIAKPTNRVGKADVSASFDTEPQIDKKNESSDKEEELEDDIDISESKEASEDDDKKKDETFLLDLSGIKNGIASLVGKFQNNPINKTETAAVSDLKFGGLSSLVKSNINVSEKNEAAQDDNNNNKTAETQIKTAELQIAAHDADVEKITVTPDILASEKKTDKTENESDKLVLTNEKENIDTDISFDLPQVVDGKPVHSPDIDKTLVSVSAKLPEIKEQAENVIEKMPESQNEKTNVLEETDVKTAKEDAPTLDMPSPEKSTITAKKEDAPTLDMPSPEKSTVTAKKEDTPVLDVPSPEKSTVTAKKEDAPVLEAPLPQKAAPVQQTASVHTLLENTKSALSDIMSKIKNAEQNFKSLFIEHEQDKQEKIARLKAKKQNIAGIPNLNNAGKMKINPVVAMEIGKNKIVATEKNFNELTEKKSAFFGSRPYAVSNAEVLTNSLLSLQTPTGSVQQNTTNSAKSSALAQMLSAEHLEGKFSPKLNHLADDVPVYVENEVDKHKLSENSRRYVFAAVDTNRIRDLSGFVGKSMTVGKKINANKDQKENKYIFTATPSLNKPFSGETGKKTSLYVK